MPLMACAEGWCHWIFSDFEKEDAETEEVHCPLLALAAHTHAVTLRGGQNTDNAMLGTEVELRCEPGYRDPHHPCQPAVLRCEKATWKTVQGVIPECCK
jgi:hypothetical protein